MQVFLTKSEIEIIELEARNSPVVKYYGVKVFNVSKLNYLNVITISDKNLILIKGNLDTAYEHIKISHNYWSTQPYPKGDGFQAQSKFPIDILPINFIEIADSIYSTENFVVNNEHKDSDKFEKYFGLYSFDGKTEEKINLILYKGTKIIHSLYPQSNKHNKNRNRTKYPFTRGIVKISNLNSLKKIKEIYIPYFGTDLKLKYSILIEKFILKEIEEWRILVYDENRNYKFDYYIGEKKISKFSGETSERISYQHCDLKNIEELILKIDISENI